MLPIDIEEYYKKKFPFEMHGEVLNLLLNIKTRNTELAHPRFLRCVLFNSANNIQSLKHQIDELFFDYRDVIVEAEYIKEKGELKHIRDFSKPFEAE